MINLLILLLIFVCVVLLQIFLSRTESKIPGLVLPALCFLLCASCFVLLVQSDCPAQHDCGKQRGIAFLVNCKHPNYHSASGLFRLPSAVQKEEPD